MVSSKKGPLLQLAGSSCLEPIKGDLLGLFLRCSNYVLYVRIWRGQTLEKLLRIVDIAYSCEVFLSLILEGL